MASSSVSSIGKGTARRVFKWLAVLALLLLVLLAAATYALHRWVGSADFRARVEREASTALGVPLALGRLQVALFPVPAVAVDGVNVKTPTPLTLTRVEVRPDWRAALAGGAAIQTLVVRDAVLPEKGVDALIAGLHKLAQREDTTGTPGPGQTRWLPRRIVLDGVTWVAATGARTTVKADAKVGDDGLPESATLRIEQGARAGTQLALSPGKDGARWQLVLDIGGGKVEGPLHLVWPVAGGANQVIELKGELKTRGVDVPAITAPGRPLSGKLEADTTLSARGTGFPALADNLQSHTRFTVHGAQINGLDLLKAVQTVGLSRGGLTQLDTLTGEVRTQGRSAQVSQLVASSGVLTARGNVSISPSKALDGRITVDVARGVTGGIVGVPLQVGGTLEAPEVTLSRTAMLGAAIGTAVMPGVGTGAGAKLGDRLGQGLKGLFGK
ncbi:hypothetical protein ACO2Q9_14625 [Variovorax sp. VNK109]|uniref:hypothetical protein n=1 Tax=Variovorax sp. VNK109 TaxID=3400919 RepID=UPI003C0F53A5